MSHASDRRERLHSPAMMLLLWSIAAAMPLTVADLELVGVGDALRVRAGDIVIESAPAVVIEVQSGVSPPVGAMPLGGPFFRVVTETPLVTARSLSRLPGVVSAFPDVILHRTAASQVEFDDPNYGGQWYLEALGMDALYAHSLGDPGTRVAVIDSAIDIAHVDLSEGVDAPYDAYADDEDPSPNPGEFCTDGSADICDEHGTAVSGIIGARGNNGQFIVGLCPTCTLVPIKLLGDGVGVMSADIAAFEYAIEQDVSVINNSWGYTEHVAVPEPLAHAIHRAATEPRGGLGALVVFAAGNDDRKLKSDELEALEDVLCVSATDSYGNPTNYTNYGAAIDVAAPSATVTLAPENTLITNFGGTSAAAPVVSGLAAWIASVDPSLSAQEIGEMIVGGAVPSPLVDFDEAGHNDYYGAGDLSALNILSALGLDPAQDSGAEEVGPSGCACSAHGAADAWGGWFGLGVLFSVRRRRRC